MLAVAQLLLVVALTTTAPPPSALPAFRPSPWFGEQVREEWIAEGVRVLANAAGDYDPRKPTRLILFATPNGNSIEQTLGCGPSPGLDWHFDIQTESDPVTRLPPNKFGRPFPPYWEFQGERNVVRDDGTLATDLWNAGDDLFDFPVTQFDQHATATYLRNLKARRKLFPTVPVVENILIALDAIPGKPVPVQLQPSGVLPFDGARRGPGATPDFNQNRVPVTGASNGCA